MGLRITLAHTVKLQRGYAHAEVLHSTGFCDFGTSTLRGSLFRIVVTAASR
jgi:hypothetical protein